MKIFLLCCTKFDNFVPCVRSERERKRPGAGPVIKRKRMKNELEVMEVGPLIFYKIVMDFREVFKTAFLMFVLSVNLACMKFTKDDN